MLTFILIITIALSLMLIVMVLLQPSKSGGVGGAFGSLNSTLGSTFGSRRTLDFLAKWTTYVAGGLALLCILANMFFVPRGTTSGRRDMPITTGTSATAPAAPQQPALPMNGGSAPAATGQGGAQQAQPNGSAPAGQQAAPSGK